RTLIAAPRCRMGPITAEERSQQRARSPVGSRYDTPIDRDSAAEMLQRKAQETAATAPPPPEHGKAPAKAGKSAAQDEGWSSRIGEWLWGTGRRQGAVEAMGKSAARTIGTRLGRQ